MTEETEGGKVRQSQIEPERKVNIKKGKKGDRENKGEYKMCAVTMTYMIFLK